MFGDVLGRILACLDYKKKTSIKKKSQNLHFSKGVSPWFWLKILLFLAEPQDDKFCYIPLIFE